MNRWKNYGLWAGIFALIPLILEGFDVHILPTNYKEIWTSILSILVTAGIINNPDSGAGYLDERGVQQNDDETE